MKFVCNELHCNQKKKALKLSTQISNSKIFVSYSINGKNSIQSMHTIVMYHNNTKFIPNTCKNKQCTHES